VAARASPGTELTTAPITFIVGAALSPVGENLHLARASTGAAQIARVGQTYVDPAIDRAAQIALPQIPRRQVRPSRC